jgi:hypothetical protein
MKKFFGAILLGLGILIAGLSGLCSMLFLSFASFQGGNNTAIIEVVALVGGIPFILGIGLIFLGRYLIQSANRSSQSVQDQSNTFR